MSGIAVFIFALKEGCLFPEDFLRKLNGVSLLKRAIEKALTMGIEPGSIHVITDSEQANLVASRMKVSGFLLGEEKDPPNNQGGSVESYMESVEIGQKLTLVLSVYAPLLQPSTLRRIVDNFFISNALVGLPERHEISSTYSNHVRTLPNLHSHRLIRKRRIPCDAFSLFKPGVVLGPKVDQSAVDVFPVGDDAFEIESLQSWWVCEKLLQRKRILFWVIGNQAVGAGHIYRSLTLAHELTDHEVIFAADTESQLAIDELSGSGYQLLTLSRSDLVNEMIDLRPDLVVLDILDTDSELVVRFRDAGVKVMSFEDLGEGSQHTDLTINELYDAPQRVGSHYRWGHQYYFVRDEFNAARQISLSKKVKGLLLTFGGTDQHDLSKKIFRQVCQFCAKRKIHIYIVTGPGYQEFKELEKETKKYSHVTLTHATGVISKIMEKCDVAVTSNGRTVYELAHMNIPSIVIAQHDREFTHSFATKENGFLPLGLYEPKSTEKLVEKELNNLVTDASLRKMLHQRMTHHHFTANKAVVLDMLRGCLDS